MEIDESQNGCPISLSQCFLLHHHQHFLYVITIFLMMLPTPLMALHSIYMPPLLQGTAATVATVATTTAINQALSPHLMPHLWMMSHQHLHTQSGLMKQVTAQWTTTCHCFSSIESPHVFFIKSISSIHQADYQDKGEVPVAGKR